MKVIIPVLFVNLFKLMLDVTLMFDGLPLVVWIVIGLLIFNAWRKKFADRRLYGMNAVDEVFLDDQPQQAFYQ